MKKIFFLIIILIIVFITYKFTYHQNKTILIITDSYTAGISNKKITYNFTDELIKNNPNIPIKVLNQSNFHLKDLQTAIIENHELLSTKAQHLIKEAQQIILFLGLEEIISQNNAQISNTEILANITEDYKYLIDLIKKYNKNIILINYYQLSDFDIDPINYQLKEIAKLNDISIIDISEFKSTQNFLNYENQLALASKVNSFLQKTENIDKNV